jgi:molecular chaperone IbpA
MTKPSLIPSWDHLNSFFVGFDGLWNEASKYHDQWTKNVPNYPPFNVKKIDENRYVIELAVAGFCKSDIEVEIAEDRLIISGKSHSDESEYPYLHKGISARAFTRTFKISDTIEVKDAGLFNGILKIVLERIIPEHKKPKKIQIKDNEPSVTASKPQLLEE